MKAQSLVSHTLEDAMIKRLDDLGKLASIFNKHSSGRDQPAVSQSQDILCTLGRHLSNSSHSGYERNRNQSAQL